LRGTKQSPKFCGNLPLEVWPPSNNISINSDREVDANITAICTRKIYSSYQIKEELPSYKMLLLNITVINRRSEFIILVK
jgi:hypothetical protein